MTHLTTYVMFFVVAFSQTAGAAELSLKDRVFVGFFPQTPSARLKARLQSESACEKWKIATRAALTLSGLKGFLLECAAPAFQETVFALNGGQETNGLAAHFDGVIRLDDALPPVSVITDTRRGDFVAGARAIGLTDRGERDCKAWKAEAMAELGARAAYVTCGDARVEPVKSWDDRLIPFRTGFERNEHPLLGHQTVATVGILVGIPQQELSQETGPLKATWRSRSSTYHDADHYIEERLAAFAHVEKAWRDECERVKAEYRELLGIRYVYSTCEGTEGKERLHYFGDDEDPHRLKAEWAVSFASTMRVYFRK